ncbi:hypothetical protein E8E14_000631 [Neopestalotiopsis sp. 37M]|nr:hypothetical protein E8E14_000631 [Neopestalotiopsis sp. 37M]
MASFFDLLEKRFGRRQRPVYDVPSNCSTICSEAQYETQKFGFSASLCVTGSDFRTYYNECAACVATSADNTTSATEYLSSAFGEYLDYCNFTDTTTTTTTTGIFYITDPTSTASTVTAGLTTLLTSASSTGLASSTTTTTSGGSSPTAESTVIAGSTSGNRAWIAGPIVGSISFVAISALAAFMVIRRRRRRNAKKEQTTTTNLNDHVDKPQLHSDSLQKPPPNELDGGMRHELPSGEPRDDKHASMTELPGTDSVLLQDNKTFGRAELPSN